MADWQDMGDGYVRNPAGLEVPREMVPPTDRIMPPQGAAPAAAPTPVAGAPAPAAPAAPQAPLTAQSVLAKLDQPAIAAARGQSQLPIAQQTTTTQSAVPMSTLKPVMDRGMARAEERGNAAIALGEEKSRIGEQQAMTASTAAYGQMQQSQAEADMHAQNAEIARQSELAVAMQKDQSIDPDRFIRSMSTGQSIGTVILAALEGGFRGMSGDTSGKNSVISILDRRIEQDIAAQKVQIESGRIRKGNTLSALRSMGMSEEAAEKGARAMAYAKAEQLTQSEMARQGAGIHRAEGQALAEQLKAAAEEKNDEWMLSIGTPRSSTTTVRQAPSAGGDGDSFIKMLAGRKAYEESGALPEQLAAFDKANGLTGAGMAPGGESKFAQDKRKSEKPTAEEAKKADALSTMQGLADSLGGLPDRVYTAESASLPKKLAHGAADLAFGEGMGEKMDLTLSKKDLEESQKFTQARSSYLSMLSVLNGQGAMADQEYNNALKAAGAANSPAQLRAAIDNTLKARGSQLRTPEQAGFRKVAP